MKKTLSIVFLLWGAIASFAQDSLCLPGIVRNSQSYLIANYTAKDTDFLNEKCRQAGLLLGHSVLANRIPTNSRLVTPKPSEHLLRQGVLQLFMPIDDKQTEIAVYHSDLLDLAGSINVLLIDNELITYHSTEGTGEINLLYNCTRGAFGTQKASHASNATVYKLWDTPERALLPDLEIQDQMAQTIAKQYAKTNYPLLIFNDLQSYAYNEYGDIAIEHLLDTMHKYNPDKMLQADLLTPKSWRYLSRVNENLPWNASMRTKIVETLTEKQELYRKAMMPWMIGNFAIHLADRMKPATTLEELEWFLSNAAAFDAGFGLEFDAETMRHHGLTDEMLNTINLWESLRLAQAFTDEQKELFKDPYANWHLEKAGDSAFNIYPLHFSRRYFCNLSDDRWTWNSPYKSRFALRIAVEGKGSISELELRTPNGILYFPCTVEAGQYLFYDFDGTAYVTDANFNKMEDILPQGVSILDDGPSEVSFKCTMIKEKEKQPEVTLRYITRGKPDIVP